MHTGWQFIIGVHMVYFLFYFIFYLFTFIAQFLYSMVYSRWQTTSRYRNRSSTSKLVVGLATTCTKSKAFSLIGSECLADHLYFRLSVFHHLKCPLHVCEMCLGGVICRDSAGTSTGTVPAWNNVGSVRSRNIFCSRSGPCDAFSLDLLPIESITIVYFASCINYFYNFHLT